MKNIILLSDGTGNGAAKKNKTNVWRMYSALNLHHDEQIAVYDDGVGSRDNLWSRIMGGAFGWGLKRNVIELYEYLCRNYEVREIPVDENDPTGPSEIEHDRIYMFGFSRGAFTVRVLAAFVAKMGLWTQYTDEKELHRFARQQFRAYWKGYKYGFLSRVISFVLDMFRPTLEPRDIIKPDIEMLGVWDTVDAYGFPIDELAVLWNWLIYPIRFPDQNLNDKVKRACHAVSVDDERYSFHPVMWNEEKDTDGRIEQVWFPGVHADVGGGYPRQSLSLGALDWMISRVESSTGEAADGLVFIDDMRQHYHKQWDWNGPQHNSRMGAALYYRYKPRDIGRICNDASAGVKIDVPKIHRSVFERIKDHSLPYAPTGLPQTYAVASTDGKTWRYEDRVPEQSKKRAEAMNYALDIIFVRRLLYFVFLSLTVLLLASRFFLDWEADGICRNSACFIDPVIQFAMKALPDFTAGWFEALRQNPKWLWGFVLIFILLFLLRRYLWSLTRRRAMCAWAVLKGKSEDRVPEWQATVISRLRYMSHQWFGPALRWLAALVLLVVIVYVLLAMVNAVIFHFRYTTGAFCHHSADRVVPVASTEVEFTIDRPCYASGIELQKGVTYLFQVEGSRLQDGDDYHTDADGFSAGQLMLFVPFRRHISQPWLRLHGKIDNRGYETFALGKGVYEYTPLASGELFLYVNDAVFGLWPEWDAAYHWEGGENRGRIVLRVAVKKP